MAGKETKESIKGENALYVFNRLLRMSNETELSTWKQNQVRNFLKHDQIDEILSLTDGFGRTILDNACIAGNLRMVQHLFPAGAKMGKPHVTMAIICSEENLPVLDYLLSHDHELSTTKVALGEDDDAAERIPLLCFCAKKGDVRPLSILLVHGFKNAEAITESIDRLGNTAIHLVGNEKVATQILNRSGINILLRRNKLGQLPIDTVMKRYTAVSSNNGFGAPFGLEEGLKKTITLFRTIMSHLPHPAQQLKRTVTPPAIKNLRGSEMLLHRQSSNNSNSSNNSSVQTHLPPRDVKSFLSRGAISKVTAQNRASLLREQREFLQKEIAALQQRHRMMDMQQQEPSLKKQHQQHFLAFQQQYQESNKNPLASMEAGPRFATPPNQNNNSNFNNKRFVADIDAAFASNNGMSPNLSLLASAANNNKNVMLHQQDIRMPGAPAKSKLPQNRFDEIQLQQLLRARYN